jgi:hypothetical protein
MAYTDIDKPTDYFNTKLYTGNGSTQTISGVGFQPDWTWIKCRSDADNHSLQDSVRGANKHLRSDSTLVETVSGTVHISSWNSDGFALGSGDGQTNASSRTYASWNWLASNTTASNTNGSITSTVSANTTSGFSIVSFTGNATAGATIGHGLGAVPSVILTKNRDFAYNWHLWTHAFSSYNDTIQLNNNAAIDTGTLLNNTAPTSSLITLGSSAVLNANGEKIIAYVFAEKKGFSKFGSYTGNGNADGTFVYTGFKPAFVMVKNTGAAENWIIFDNKRPGYNLTDALLKPSLSNAESTTGVKFDLLSNGFKARVSDAEGNSSGDNFIYMAFAEEPFVTSTGIPGTAR